MIEQAALSALGTLTVLLVILLLCFAASAILYGHEATNRLEEALKPDEKWRTK